MGMGSRNGRSKWKRRTRGGGARKRRRGGRGVRVSRRTRKEEDVLFVNNFINL